MEPWDYKLNNDDGDGTVNCVHLIKEEISMKLQYFWIKDLVLVLIVQK